MTTSKHLKILAIPTVLILLVNAMIVTPAYAGDETPPPADGSSEAVPAAVETGAAENPSAAVADPLPQGILPALPEDTDLVVLDENGTSLPLATEQAVEAITLNDPIWCPNGKAPNPGVGGCSSSYSDITSLVAGFVPGGNGTIWVQYGAAPTGNATIDGSGSWAAAKNFSITFQGGWNGSYGSKGLNGANPTSTFGDSLTITSWVGAVTLKNVTFEYVTFPYAIDENALSVTTAGNIVLDKVQALNTTNSDPSAVGGGAKLDNSAGPGSVTVTNSNFMNNEGDGLSILSAHSIMMKNVYVSGNGGLYFGASLNNMAATTAQPITVTDSGFYDNGTGLWALTFGAVTLRNITAAGNSGEGTGIDVYVLPGTTASALKVLGTNTFSGNGGAGLWIESRGAITLNNVTAKSNTGLGYGVFLDNGAIGPLPPQNVTITGYLRVNGNSGYGLYLSSDGAVAIANLTASGNGVGTWIDNKTGAVSAHKPVTLTGIYTISSSSGFAAFSILSNGAVTLHSISASSNPGGYGLSIKNDYDALVPQNVTLFGASSFSSNGGPGLFITTYGAVTLSNVTASNNGGRASGVTIDNSGGSIAKAVTISGTNTFNSNSGAGLHIVSRGTISLNEITANSNGVGADLNNSTATSALAVTLTGTNEFNTNGSGGLIVTSQGKIVISGLNASNNVVDGTYLNNAGLFQSAVTLTGNTTLIGNGVSGIDIHSHGAISAMNLSVYNNGHNGAQFNTQGLTAPQTITLTGSNIFTGNGVSGGYSGLVAYSDGNIVISNFTANGNNGNGVYLDNLTNWAAGSFLTFGSITLTGSYTTSNNSTDGLYVSSHGAVTLSNLTAAGNSGGDGVAIVADGNVTLACVTTSGNLRGVWMYASTPLLTLKGFISYGNTSGNQHLMYTTLVFTHCP